MTGDRFLVGTIPMVSEFSAGPGNDPHGYCGRTPPGEPKVELAKADLFDDELDNIAAALDSLDDLSQATSADAPIAAARFGPILAPSPRPIRRRAVRRQSKSGR